MYPSLTVYLILIFSSITGMIASSSQREEIPSSPFKKTFRIRKTWVKNYIKFEYLRSMATNSKAKIHAIGCSPTNTDSGPVVAVNDTYRDGDFEYLCAVDGDLLSFEAIGCIYNSTSLKPGSGVIINNSTTMLSCALINGVVKKVFEKVAGCYFNGTVYEDSDYWVEPLLRQPWKVDSMMTGLLMQCFRPHYTYFENQIAGCVIGKIGIRINDFATIDDQLVKCSEVSYGELDIIRVSMQDVECELDGKRFTHNTTWVDVDRGAMLSCKYANILKKGCLLENSTFLDIGQEYRLNENCMFLCHTQGNIYICERTLTGNETQIAPYNITTKEIEQLFYL